MGDREDVPRFLRIPRPRKSLCDPTPMEGGRAHLAPGPPYAQALDLSRQQNHLFLVAEAARLDPVEAAAGPKAFSVRRWSDSSAPRPAECPSSASVRTSRPRRRRYQVERLGTPGGPKQETTILALLRRTLNMRSFIYEEFTL